MNIIDIHAERPLKSYVVYTVAKAGLSGLTRALARELGPEVRVNGVAPGPILWPADGSFDELARQRVDHRRRCSSASASPTTSRPRSNSCVAEAPYVTGQIVAVDGGRSVNL